MVGKRIYLIDVLRCRYRVYVSAATAKQPRRAEGALLRHGLRLGGGGGGGGGGVRSDRGGCGQRVREVHVEQRRARRARSRAPRLLLAGRCRQQAVTALAVTGHATWFTVVSRDATVCQAARSVLLFYSNS